MNHFDRFGNVLFYFDMTILLSVIPNLNSFPKEGNQSRVLLVPRSKDKVTDQSDRGIFRKILLYWTHYFICVVSVFVGPRFS